jgi:hypothetical protein
MVVLPIVWWCPIIRRIRVSSCTSTTRSRSLISIDRDIYKRTLAVLLHRRLSGGYISPRRRHRVSSRRNVSHRWAVVCGRLLSVWVIDGRWYVVHIVGLLAVETEVLFGGVRVARGGTDEPLERYDVSIRSS